MAQKISIIVRAFNEEKHIGKLLQGIQEQKISCPVETVLVDSGSKDGTVAIAQKYGVSLVSIDPESFSFGYSLNKGIESATGDICVIVSAHCYPDNDQWLEQIIRPFSNEKVALVYGKQRGHPTLTKYAEHQVFAQWFPEESDEDQKIHFCNNANAAVRRSLWEKWKYDEKLTGLEDVQWAKNAVAQGYSIAYCAEACVIHVHEETYQQVYRRYEREALAFVRIHPEHRFGFFDFLKFFALNFWGDSAQALKEGVFFHCVGDVFMFRLLQFWATYRGNRMRQSISQDMRHRLYYPRNPELFEGGRAVAERTEKTLEVYDISRPLVDKMPVWPGSEPFNLEWKKNMGAEGCNESHLSMNTHTGTHMDAPFHFLSSGARMEGVDLEKMLGRVRVLKYLKKEPIDVDFFRGASIPSGCRRLLLKTLNSHETNGASGFDTSFVAITAESAEWLVQRKIELIGIDGCSIQCYGDKDNKTHRILLEANVVILEGLNLAQVEEGDYNLLALPLNIPQGEGAPVRAVLTKGQFS